MSKSKANPVAVARRIGALAQSLEMACHALDDARQSADLLESADAERVAMALSLAIAVSQRKRERIQAESRRKR